MAELRNPEAGVRKRAARTLRESTPFAAPALLEAARAESDEGTKREIMLALGNTGVDDAKPVLEDFVAKAENWLDRMMAGRALKSWLIVRGVMETDSDLPSGWPYGTPGYPPKN